MKNIITCFFMLFFAGHAHSQVKADTDKAIAMLTKAGAAFAAGDLSFDVYYTYANEHQPGTILDSLKGNMQLANNSYRTELGNTLMVKNSHYSIIVFKEDKLIHVSKPVQADSVGASPVDVVTASIRQAGVQSASVTEKGDVTFIRFIFPEKASYKYMEIKLDNKSWLITELQYVVKSSLLSSPGEENDIVYEPYALVKTLFNHYKKGPVDPAVFDERQFFTRKTNTLIPAPAFEDYEVFIGTPNL